MGVQGVQGGRVHPLEGRAEAEADARWTRGRTSSSSFKLTMAQLRDYLRVAGVSAGGWVDGAGPGPGGDTCGGDDGDDEATEPSERGGGGRWAGGMEAASSGGSIGSLGNGSRADSDEEPDELSESGDMTGIFRQVWMAGRRGSLGPRAGAASRRRIAAGAGGSGDGCVRQE